MTTIADAKFPELTPDGTKLMEALVSPIIGTHRFVDVTGVQRVQPCPEAVKHFLTVFLTNINNTEIEDALRRAFLVHVHDWTPKMPTHDLGDYFAAYTSAANLLFPDTLNNKDYRKVHRLLYKITATLLDN